ncbi:sterol 3-beta-glucosyltransferase UGT80A2 [Lactuca sativa]|uniref:sterol 3-beta-glucosyltransferase UGT80A2 n=1 Tax=Lactuca sativa TaxID=4236 RepID=UPI0022AF1416|nr:sterol 3-beta-glucosyltransferase UGT80A2 [Lactuca sativa]
MEFLQQEEFPHPLSRVKQSAGYRFSYQIGDSLIWLGIRDMINDVWKKKLNLRPITYFSGYQGSENDIPHRYIWSPHLVPKPKDWGPKIYVVGFCFLDLTSNYKPLEELVCWLKAGPKPIYIGFGSLCAKFGKLNKSVEFPEILDMAPYVSGSSDKSPVYRLYGVVVHVDTMNDAFSGHYVCYVKNHHNQWFKFNDTMVNEVDLQHVLTKGAYMLFYARCSPRTPRSIRSSIIQH